MTYCIAVIRVFFNDTATTEIYTLSLHDALPILVNVHQVLAITVSIGLQSRALTEVSLHCALEEDTIVCARSGIINIRLLTRSEEHTSELQSRQYLVCRLLLEKKNILVKSQSLIS